MPGYGEQMRAISLRWGLGLMLYALTRTSDVLYLTYYLVLHMQARTHSGALSADGWFARQVAHSEPAWQAKGHPRNDRRGELRMQPGNNSQLNAAVHAFGVRT